MVDAAYKALEGPKEFFLLSPNLKSVLGTQTVSYTLKHRRLSAEGEHFRRAQAGMEQQHRTRTRDAVSRSQLPRLKKRRSRQ